MSKLEDELARNAGLMGRIYSAQDLLCEKAIHDLNCPYQPPDEDGLDGVDCECYVHDLSEILAV